MSRADTAAAPLVHPTARFERPGLALLARGAVFLVAMAVALAVLLHFHDRFWWAPAEGAQAIYAERLLNGALRDVPPDAVHWVNALAFKLFGSDLVSLRYPLLALTLAQSALAFWLLAERGVLIAFAAALAMSCLTFVQFLAPAAPWYALFICLLLVVVLSDSKGERRGSLELVGFLLVLLFLFQPLGGVLATLGVLTCLLLQEQRHPGRERAFLARGLLLVSFAGLALYLRASFDLLTAALFGTAPLLLLGTAVVVTRLGTGGVLRLVLRLAVGGLLALGPLVAFHLTQGSLADWGAKLLTVGFAPAVTGLAEGPDAAGLLMLSLAGITAGGQGAALLNGLFWSALLLLPAGLGLLLLRALWRGAEEGRAPLPIIACFFAVISAASGTPLGLFFSAALTLAALLFLAGARGRLRRFALAAGGIALTLVGLSYQAGQPLSRGWDDTVAGQTRTVVAPLGLPRAGLTVAAEEAALYGLLVNLIERHSAATEEILALPASPELAFLSGRTSALGMVDAARRLNDPRAFDEAAARLAEQPPRLLIVRPGDAYNTVAVRRLAEGLRQRYRLVETAGGYAIYQLDD